MDKRKRFYEYVLAIIAGAAGLTLGKIAIGWVLAIN